VLLLLSVCINYVDRGSLSVAAPVIAKEFSLSDQRLGYLLSAFFLELHVVQLVVGWLVDRRDVKWVYASGFLVWSVAMAPPVWRTVFALCSPRDWCWESGKRFPAVGVQNCCRLFPAERRGLPNALVDVGRKLALGSAHLPGVTDPHMVVGGSLFIPRVAQS